MFNIKTLAQLVFVVAVCVVIAIIGIGYSPYVQQGFAVTLGIHAEQASSESIVGGPDISATFIDSVLAQAHSPASGLGQVLYQQGAQYHIKPSFALSVFHM